MNQLILGAISMACLVVSLFFLRFWKNTGDRFFLYFSAAFALEGVNRGLLGFNQATDENEPLFYLIRLVSYILILVAILDKNSHRSAASNESHVAK